MNTVRSVGYGWGVLIVAGGGAYYFAKRSINADRAERAVADAARKRSNEEMRYKEYSQRAQSSAPPPPSVGSSGNPSEEASQDPAPTRHAPETDKQSIVEKSKYESSEPFRSKKGDRLS